MSDDDSEVLSSRMVIEQDGSDDHQVVALDSPQTDQPSSPTEAVVQTSMSPMYGANPFRHSTRGHNGRPRENFPSFDRAMGNVSPSPPPTHNDDSLNRSGVSSAGASNTSSLNMSIGARAALNEHLRHIARYGIDGSRSGSSSRTSSPVHREHQRQELQGLESPAVTPPRNPLDVAWDQLLVGNGQYQTFSSSFSPPKLKQMDTLVTVSSGDLEGTEAIEVSPTIGAPASAPDTTIQRYPLPWEVQEDARSGSSKSTSSFFNSSRVLQLRTPDRNRSLASLPAVTLRDVDYQPDSPSVLEESLIEGDSGSEMAMVHMFHALTMTDSSPPLNNSFTSFVGADLSRISGGSPDVSFQHQQHAPLFAASFEEGRSPLDSNDSPTDGPPPPPPPPPGRNTSDDPSPLHRSGRFFSSASVPAARHRKSFSPPRRRQFSLQKQRSCPLTRTDEATSKALMGKENAPNSRVTREGNILSPAALKAGASALEADKHRLQEGPSRHNLMDYFREPRTPVATLLHTTISVDASEEVSTLNNSSSSGPHNTSSSSSSMGRYKKVTTVTKTAAAATPSTAILNKSTLSSSSSSSFNLQYLDRRRYRTVVPSRVFMKEEPPEGFFPVANDSFSANDDRKLPANKQKLDQSLQHSFEAAYQTSLEESQQLQEYWDKQQQGEDSSSWEDG